MSYDAAQKGSEYTGQTELVISLEDKGAAEKAGSALRRQNIHAGFDPSIPLAWELLQKQFWQMGLLSIVLMSSAVVLIREKRAAEKHRCHSEAAMLYLSGLTAESVRMIYPLRIVLILATVLLFALLSALLLGEFSVWGIGVSIPLTNRVPVRWTATRCGLDRGDALIQSNPSSAKNRQASFEACRFLLIISSLFSISCCPTGWQRNAAARYRPAPEAE